MIWRLEAEQIPFCLRLAFVVPRRSVHLEQDYPCKYKFRELRCFIYSFFFAFSFHSYFHCHTPFPCFLGALSPHHMFPPNQPALLYYPNQLSFLLLLFVGFLGSPFPYFSFFFLEFCITDSPVPCPHRL